MNKIIKFKPFLKNNFGNDKNKVKDLLDIFRKINYLGE